MLISLILGHPKPASLNHAIAEAVASALVKDGHQLRMHDLYRERFDPVLTVAEAGGGASSDPLVEQHCREATEADGLVIVHPNWWGQPPALLKGWIERVFRLGSAYRFDEAAGPAGPPLGLLTAQVAVVINTSDTPPDREAAVFGDPLERIWRDCVFGFCGVSRVERRVVGPVITASPETTARWRDETAEWARSVFRPAS